MVDPRVSKVVEDIVSDIDTEVELKPDRNLTADEFISRLTNDGGNITVLDDEFTVRSKSESELEYVSDLYKSTFGIDGSTTTDLTFENGLILSVSVAGVSAAERDPSPPVCREKSIWAIIYFEDNKIDFSPSIDSDEITVTFGQFPDIKRKTSQIGPWVKSISQGGAEAEQFKKAAPKVDQPLFLDGPIFPPDIFMWVIHDQIDEHQKSPMPEYKDMIQDIFQMYIDAIEECFLNEVPIFGIQKTSKSQRVLNDLKRKSPNKEEVIPWNSDGWLFYSALDESHTDITYTPWYVEDKIGGDEKIIPLKDYNEIELSYDYSMYKRAFFYAKPPIGDTVFRVGIPMMYIEHNMPYTKEELQDIALNELRKEASEEPLAIKLADDKINISKELRRRIYNIITSSSHISRDQQRKSDYI